MKCPVCGFAETTVKDSRPTDDQGAIRRRRACDSCGFRFTTFERPQLREIFVVKKNGQEEAFSRTKLERSIRTAFNKRALTAGTIDSMIARIMARLEVSDDLRISTQKLGEMVLRELITIDAVAYVRFASIYEQFKDVQNFVVLVNKIAQVAVEEV